MTAQEDTAEQSPPCPSLTFTVWHIRSNLWTKWSHSWKSPITWNVGELKASIKGYWFSVIPTEKSCNLFLEFTTKPCGKCVRLKAELLSLAPISIILTGFSDHIYHQQGADFNDICKPKIKPPHSEFHAWKTNTFEYRKSWENLSPPGNPWGTKLLTCSLGAWCEERKWL